jgi:hypothetical protein
MAAAADIECMSAVAFPFPFHISLFLTILHKV